VRTLNKARRLQRQKIDILCNDLVTAQKDFIKLVSKLSFVADSFEQLLGATDLNQLFAAAQTAIRSANPSAEAVFFLLTEEGFEIHNALPATALTKQVRKAAGYFCPKLVRNISNCNKVALVEDMFKMGLQGNLALLNQLHLTAVPLAQNGVSLGFILICCPADSRLTPPQTQKILAIIPGLRRAIDSSLQGPILNHQPAAG